MTVSQSELQTDGKTVKLFLNEITPIDGMTISYDIVDTEDNQMQGTVQNTIHSLRLGAFGTIELIKELTSRRIN